MNKSLRKIFCEQENIPFYVSDFVDRCHALRKTLYKYIVEPDKYKLTQAIYDALEEELDKLQSFHVDSPGEQAIVSVEFEMINRMIAESDDHSENQEKWADENGAASWR